MWARQVKRERGCHSRGFLSLPREPGLPGPRFVEEEEGGGFSGGMELHRLSGGRLGRSLCRDPGRGEMEGLDLGGGQERGEVSCQLPDLEFEEKTFAFSWSRYGMMESG